MIKPFVLFNKEISIYMIFIMIGIFTAGILACRVARKRGHDDNDMISILLFAAIGALFGGHILYGFTNFNYMVDVVMGRIIIDSFNTFVQTSNLIFGGSVFYGGLLGSIFAGYQYGKYKKFDLKEYSDMLAPIIPFFHMFGRIGCFLGGCCYGVESKFGFVYTNNPVVQANGVSRFPVQLLEALFNLLLFSLLYYFLNRHKWKGKLLYLYLLSYSLFRFLTEYLRGDSYRGFLWGLSTSQIISILIFTVTFITGIVVYYKDKRSKI